MDMDSFSRDGIEVIFQKFEAPAYDQKYAEEFCTGLSILDVLLNCGIDRTKELFDRRNQ